MSCSMANGTTAPIGSPWDVRTTLRFLAESNMLRILARACDTPISFGRPLRYDATLNKVALLLAGFFNSLCKESRLRSLIVEASSPCHLLESPLTLYQCAHIPITPTATAHVAHVHIVRSHPSQRLNVRRVVLESNLALGGFSLTSQPVF
jgi:hypothetical protein